MALTGLSGTARENTDASNKKLSDISVEKKAIAEQIAAERPIRDELKLAIDHMSIRISEEEATDRLMSTSSTIVLGGWMPASEEKLLAERLKDFDCAWETRDPTEDETANVPVMLKDGPLAAPFTMITQMYSLPAYNGVDPNPFLLPFFSVFFGIMFADMGLWHTDDTRWHVYEKKDASEGWNEPTDRCCYPLWYYYIYIWSSYRWLLR